MKKFTSLLLFCLLLLGLAACNGWPAVSPSGTASALTGTQQTGSTRTPRSAPSPTVEMMQGTISLWHAWDDDQLPALLGIIASFQETYPGILFDVLYVPPQNLYDRYFLAASEGGGPSILLATAEWGPQLFDAGLVADLTGRPNPATLERLSPPALGTGQYRGSLISLPYSQRGVVLYRNRQIIPESPTTFDDLIRLAQLLTEGDQIGAILERSPYFAGGHIYGFGGSLMDEDNYPMFNTPAGLAWVELLQTFAQAGPPDYFTDNDLDLFRQGRVGFVIDGTWNRYNLAEAIGVAYLEIDPWPVHDHGALAGFVHADNLYLNAKSSEATARLAWLFIEHMLSEESQALLGPTSLIPVVDITLESKLADQALNALAGGVTYPIQPQFSVYLDPLDQALRSVFDSGVPREQALQTAEEAIRTALQNTSPAP